MRTEIVLSGTSLYDDPDNLSITLHTGPRRQTGQFRRFDRGKVHLVISSFVDDHGLERSVMLCGVPPKRSSAFSPVLDLSDVDVKFDELCALCTTRITTEFKDRKPNEVKDMPDVIPVTVVKAAPPTKYDPHTVAKDALRELMDTAIESPDEWVSIEMEGSGSASMLYREWARRQIEVVHRKGRLYLKVFPT